MSAATVRSRIPNGLDTTKAATEVSRPLTTLASPRLKVNTDTPTRRRSAAQNNDISPRTRSFSAGRMSQDRSTSVNERCNSVNGNATSNAPETDGLQVCVRIRPPPLEGLTDKHRPRSYSDNEIFRTDGSVAWRWSDKRIVYQEPVDREYYYGNQAQQYMFSNVFPMNTTTEAIFERIGKPIVQRTFEGYNCCIFAFGQTNSGKTFTISGTPDSPGIISLAVQCFFEYIASKSDQRSLLRVAFLEVYNEQLKDLLSDKGAPLNVKDDPDRGCPVVVNLTEHVVSSLDEVIQLASAGEKRRVFGCNNVHEHASRSHTVFQLIFESRNANSAEIRVSTLNIVDLAGSELAFTHLEGAPGIDHTMPMEHKTREREGANIRRSLLTLSRVVETLASNPNGHIPYRDSKLTRILQSALGGNSSTAMIATINPWMSGVDDRQSNSTLRFAVTAQRVNNHPKRVNLISPEQALLEQYETELRDLRDQMNRYDDSVEKKEELIWKLREEKECLTNELHSKLNRKDAALKEKEDKLREKEKRQEELRKQYENLSRFVLTSKNLQGQDLRTVVQGIGIDEESYYYGHDKRRAKAPEEAEEDLQKTMRLRRRASFCCLRDARSSSLFGMVDKAGVAGCCMQTRIGSSSPEFSAADRTEFEQEKNRVLVEQKKQEIVQLQQQCQGLGAQIKKLNEQLAIEQRNRDTSLDDIDSQLKDWEAMCKFLEPEAYDKEVLDEIQKVNEMWPSHDEVITEEILVNLRKGMAAVRNVFATNLQDALGKSTDKSTEIGNLRRKTHQLQADLEASASKCSGLEAELESQKVVIEQQEEEAKRLNSIIKDRDATIARLEKELAEQRELYAAEHNRRLTLETEKSAFEKYFKGKQDKKSFKALRALFGSKEKFLPDYKPWLRNTPAIMAPNSSAHPAAVPSGNDHKASLPPPPQATSSSAPKT